MQVRVTPSGYIDKDTDPQYVGQGNYLDGQNIRHRQTDGQNFGGVMTVDGNSLAVSIPAYPTSTRSYRVYIDVEDIANGSVAAHEGELYLTTSAGDVYQNLTANISTTNLASYRSAMIVYLDALSNSAYGGLLTHSALVTTGTYTAYWDVSTGLDTEWKLTEVGVVSNLCTFRLASEYIASNGVFSPIGSIQLNDDLFILSAGSVTNVDGTSDVSEIGVMHPSGAGYAYKRLMRSKQLTFHQERNADMQIEKVGTQINIYWTDNTNEPRVIYLKESLKNTTDGLLYINGGRYEFDSVDSETLFFAKNYQLEFSNIEVLENAGTLTAGNKRYTARLLTEDFVSPGFTYPTNPINIYAASFSSPEKIQGDQFGTITDKAVSMRISNIPPGEFAFLEFIALEYDQQAVYAKIIQRYKLDSQQTTINVVHTDLGQENIPISNAEIISLNSKYIKAKNIRLFDNRLVLSNLTEEVDININEWAQTIQHSITEDYITGVGIARNPNGSLPGYAFGEYMDPQNVLDKVGYMYNDTYRFGIQVQWKKTNKWSLPYWVDDIRIDNSASNVVGTRRKTFGGSVTAVDTGTETITVPNHGFYDGQAIIFTATTIGGLFTGTIYYVLNATQNTFQVTPIYGGTTPENLTSGGTGTVVDKKVDTNLTDVNAELTKLYHVVFHNIDLDYDISGTKIRDLISGYRFVRSERIEEVIATGYYFIGTTIIHPSGYLTPRLLYNNTVLNAPGPTAGYSFYDVFFYSPDFYYGKSYEHSDLDKVKILGPIDNTSWEEVSGYAFAPVGSAGKFRDYSGFFVDPTVTTLNYADYTVSGYTHVDQGGKGKIGASNYATSVELSSTRTFTFRDSEVFKLTSPIAAVPATLSTSELGWYYGQIFRDLGGNKKYPINKEQSSYINIGHIQYLSEGDNGIKNGIKIYGGDTFTQKSFMLLQMVNREALKTAGNTGASFGFYSQNTQNLQMIDIEQHNGEFNGPGHQFPQDTDKSFGGNYTIDSWGSGVVYWCEQWPEVSNQRNYSNSYDIKDLSLIEYGFDENNDYDGKLPTRIAWSAKKILGSLKDSYRQFSPLDFADLDLTHGEISHHEVLNNSFYTWQARSFQRQYFRDASLLNSQEGSDIVVGSGSILAAPGQEYSSIGSSKKWSIVKGTNNNGKDTVYWFNDVQRKMMRFAQDGVNVISDRGMTSWFLNNTAGYENKEYPLSGQGVHGVWNTKYNEAVFTFLPGEGNAYTLVYDEMKNGFISFNTHYPKLYMPYKTGFFAPNPGNHAQIYLFDSGSEGTFFGVTSPGTIEAIMNYDGNMPKNFEAIQVNSELVPKLINFETRNHLSYLDDVEFDYREDYYYSPIKNDSTASGANDEDSSRLWGRWIKIDMSLASVSGGQKLVNFVVKFRPMMRLYSQ